MRQGKERWILQRQKFSGARTCETKTQRWSPRARANWGVLAEQKDECDLPAKNQRYQKNPAAARPPRWLQGT
jgi:hypothetical protein